MAASAMNNYIDERIAGDFPATLVDVDEPIRPLRDVDDFLDTRHALLEMNGGGGHYAGAVADVNPFAECDAYVSNLDYGIKDLLGSDNALIAAVSSYLFAGDTGKKVRPAMVVLMAQATQRPGGAHADAHADAAGGILPSQLRLAEITEMIHTASLLHDDVIDGSDTRRGRDSVNKVFGNKLSILAGDFLLARASVALARLRDVEVVEVLSTVIEHLVKGELMQINAPDYEGRLDAMQYYMRKNYYKTGSLIANSCMAATLLGDCDRATQEAALDYGLGCGLAFQLVDDLLDFESTQSVMGKPTLNDVKSGLVTAPVLYAADAFPDEVQPLIARKFTGSGDVEAVLHFVGRADGIARTRDLAVAYAERSVHAVMQLPPSRSRDALAQLARKVAHRTA
eukprot:g1517.t1